MAAGCTPPRPSRNTARVRAFGCICRSRRPRRGARPPNCSAKNSLQCEGGCNIPIAISNILKQTRMKWSHALRGHVWDPMLAENETPFRAELLSPDRLEAHALSLAGIHVVSKKHRTD